MAALASSANDTSYSIFVTAPDGLRLHVRCYGRASAAGIPVVCLPGLARTAADFDALATELSRDGPHPRRVIALPSLYITWFKIRQNEQPTGPIGVPTPALAQ